MAARTFRKLHRDVSACTSGHNGYYVGTYQMLHRDVISSLPWQCVAIRWQQKSAYYHALSAYNQRVKCKYDRCGINLEKKNILCPTHKKKGSAETTLPHGLDESYNHLSRDRLTIRFTYRFLRHLLRYMQVHYNQTLPSYRLKPHSLPSSY